MAITVVRGGQVKDASIQRVDLDTSTVGQAVIAKLVQGFGIQLTSTGGDAGTGDVTVAVASSLFRVKSDGSFQLWNPDQSKWHTLQVRGAAGGEYITIGAGE